MRGHFYPMCRYKNLPATGPAAGTTLKMICAAFNCHRRETDFSPAGYLQYVNLLRAAPQCSLKLTNPALSRSVLPKSSSTQPRFFASWIASQNKNGTAPEL